MNTRLVTLGIALLVGAPVWSSADDAFFHSAGVRLRYVVQGQGEPVVLLHGISRTAEHDWIQTGVLPALARQFQVLALDQRGHGRSDKPVGTDAYGVRMVEDVARLLEHRGLARAHVVGYSMGGRIALKFLATHPQRVQSVVVVGSGGVLEEEDASVFQALAAELDAGRGFASFIPHVWPVGQVPSAEQVAAINAETLSRNDPRALAAVARGFAAWRVAPAQLATNRLPVLAVVGDLDPARAGVERLQVGLPSLQVEVIAGADHLSLLSDPRLLDVLRAFWAGRHGRTGGNARLHPAP
ncbi:MAG: alpha/beta fold hydrolase [Verrucomicrobia bacterium]|nr:alpha/beta fold hydrolase [Verrucomicrobiota bacterium]